MKVEFIDHMGSDLSVVNAARVSFDKESEWEIKFLNKDNGDHSFNLSNADTKLIKYLAKHNHWSPFAHTCVSMRIKAPIFVARQLGKHQVGLVWNEVSRRYVDSEPEFYIPEAWRKRAENVKQGSSDEVAFTEEVAGFKDHCRFAKDFYQDLLDSGACPEQARMVLPQSMMTEWIWTGSMLAFNRVCKLRLDSHTQKETQEIAKQIAEIIKPLFPVSWKALMENGNDEKNYSL